jgi:hypothetical protein
MKLFIRKWMFVSIIGAFFVMGTSGLYAEESRVLPKGMTSAKLKASVVKMFNYVDQRLLNGKNAKKIEASENHEAIARLQRSREDMDMIAARVKQGQFEKAYWALKDLNVVLKDAIKMSWLEERAAKEAKDRLDSACAISDAYYVRAKQRGIHNGDRGAQALDLLISAQEKRIRAQALEADKDYKEAATVYQKSTELLRKAITTARKQGRNNSVAKLY